MRLEPLYRIRFTYPEGWGVELEGGWQQLFFIAEGRCEASITGRFRVVADYLRAYGDARIGGISGRSPASWRELIVSPRNAHVTLKFGAALAAG
ncbi:MAG: hypothetical protein ACLQFR_00640 [Streptosporangiaceae bacterium]